MDAVCAGQVNPAQARKGLLCAAMLAAHCRAFAP